MRVAIQGQRGSFHDEAAGKFFAGDFTVVPCDSFAAVFLALRDGRADFGVVAVENSLYGSLHETYDQLLRSRFTIIGEVALQIQQCLIARPGATLSCITTVMSHPAALDQCREFLARELPHAQLIEHADTAGAVAELTDLPATTAAIASRHAAQLHQMAVLAEDIADEPDNVTRFIVLSPRPKQIDGADKASLIITTQHQPGALHQALGIISQNNCNMTKIESRPVRGQPFRYQFIIDIMANQAQLISVCHELEQSGCSVTVLGHYCADTSSPK